ncbi:MAG: Holliday junction branch migration protein RuvA [Spartobacteria bacterium]|nr:Holliday junction branch migration protein RuvA [Spartobacteria bacterium]
MICFVEGILEEKTPARIIINAGGIGYEVFIPLSSYDRLPLKGQSCRVLTHHHIREDAHILFGFTSSNEKDLFERLIAISGIGPKLALSILSGMNVRDFKSSILNGDVKRLSSISGIGKRMAERLIVEMKGKITAAEALEVSSNSGDASSDHRSKDAVLALVSLGYKQVDAVKMIHKIQPKISESTTVEDLIRMALVG